MTQFNLSFDFELEPDFFEDLLDTAGHSIGYWANSASIETMTEDDDEIIYRVNEEDGEEFIITKSDMERTICNIIFGKYSGVSQILKKDLTLLCLCDDDVDIDAVAADSLIQLCCFHEVRYA